MEQDEEVAGHGVMFQKHLHYHQRHHDDRPGEACRRVSGATGGRNGSGATDLESVAVSGEKWDVAQSHRDTSQKHICKRLHDTVPGEVCRSALGTTAVSNGSCAVPGDLESAPAADTLQCGEDEDEELMAEVQQGYRIFQSFLQQKHKALTAPLRLAVAPGDLSLRRMEEKFGRREYRSITQVVSDLRLLLENCYRCHGVDHFLSKQAQKLELMLEQKLTLLPRSLREKTRLAVTSRGRFGSEDEKVAAVTSGTSELPGSSRRRRNLAAVAPGGCESVMVQALRLEEQRRAKEEKRQREMEKKEAEEASAREAEEWERQLLSSAEPWHVGTVWELPAIAHFLCLAQSALNLPEIVFYQLERCLLISRCSSFLDRVMTSLLCPPHRRAALHRRPPLPYRRWEAELRRRVLGWYRAVGGTQDGPEQAERLGLCRRFFWTLGESSPLEEVPFHLLPFLQRVWLLKGLCDHVYETQKEVREAVQAQPVHECRESVLGYDIRDNAYIHFPHFCGADLRIYCQSPCAVQSYPLPPLQVKKLQLELEEGAEDIKVRVENWDSDSARLCPWLLSSTPGAEKGEMPCPKSVKEKEEEVEEVKHSTELTSTNSVRALSPSCTRPVPSTFPECLVQRSFKALQGHLGSGTEIGHSTKRKKKKWHRVRAGTKTLCMRRMGQGRGIRTTHCAVANSVVRRHRRRKHKSAGGRFDPSKAGGTQHHQEEEEEKEEEEEEEEQHPHLPTEPTFQLVCSSVEELRELISKTEDELDELESSKKRCERWNTKRQAVKELHITLIRLLNELLPWEPKLLKAFHKNRARMKKEYDDFINHPEYVSFVREEWTLDEGELEEEDRMERIMKEGLGTAVYETHLGNESLAGSNFSPEVLREFGPFTRSSKRHQARAVLEDFGPSKRGKIGTDDSAISGAQSEILSQDQKAVMQFSAAMTPAASFQGRCKPIQALLARSVGNKVTLTSHPQATVMAQALKTSSSTVPVPASKPATPVPTQTQASTSPSAPPVHAAAQVLSLEKEDSVPIKLSLQSVLNQNPGDTVMQQIVILPPHLLVQKPEEKRAHLLSGITALPKAKTMSGFMVQQSKIPVQYVAPLKDPSTVKTPAPAVPHTVDKSPQCCISPMSKKASELSSTSHRPSIPSSSCFGPDQYETKQELKTVCIRDSQSILVTTRGGNTGVVKVQTCAESQVSTLPSSPVFSIPQQFDTFLVSKSSAVTTFKTPADHTNSSTASVLNVVAPLIKSSTVFTAVPPPSPLKCSMLSLLLEGARAKTVNQNNHCTDPVTSVSCSQEKNTQKLDSNNSALPHTSQSGPAVHSAVQALQGIPQSFGAFKNTIIPPQKGSQVCSFQTEPANLHKMLQIKAKTGITAALSNISNTTHSAQSTATGSGVRVLSKSISARSKVTIRKGCSESKSTTLSSDEVMNIRLNLGQAISKTTASTLTKVQGINVSGLKAKILNEVSVTSTETATELAPVMVSTVLTPPLSGLIFVQQSNPSTSSYNPSPSSTTKDPATLEGRTLTFSAYGKGHMASSALLSTVQQKNASPLVSTAVPVQRILNNGSEVVVGCSTQNVASPVLGTVVNKDTTFIDKSWLTIPAVLPVRPQFMASVPDVLTSTTTTFSFPTPSLAPRTVMGSVVRSAVLAGTTRVQEKVVISTSAPLAPGTQLLINNTRFVVPPPGLSCGSHVLLISNPAVDCALETSLAPLVQRGTSTLSSTPFVVQGPRFPAPSTVKVGPSVPICQPLDHVRSPHVVSVNSTAQAQVSQATFTVGQPNLTSILRLPSVSPPEGYPCSPATFHSASKHSSQTQRVSQPAPQRPALSQVFPAPPMSGMSSKMLTIPVATVPPISGTTSSSQAVPVAMVPPSVNTVIVAPYQTGDVRVPVVVAAAPPQQRYRAAAGRASSPQKNAPRCKLLLSTDGAVLNILCGLPGTASPLPNRALPPGGAGSVTGPAASSLHPHTLPPPAPGQ